MKPTDFDDVQLREHGFAFFGLTTRDTATPLPRLVEAMERVGVYEFRNREQAIWGRLQRRGGNALLQRPTRRLARIDALERNPRPLELAVGEYLQTIYAHHHNRGRPCMTAASMRRSYAHETMVGFGVESWKRLSNSIFFAHPEYLLETIRDHAAPRWLQWFPHGSVHLYLTNCDFEARLAALRTVRVMNEYDAAEMAPQVPKSLQAWQSVSADEFLETTLEWASLLTFPHMTAFTAGCLGLNIVFFPNAEVIYEAGVFPVSSLEFKRGNAEFGRQSAPRNLGNPDVTVPLAWVHGKYVWQRAIDCAEPLSEWVLEKASNVLECVSDVVYFERTIHGIRQVDFALPQEQLWSLDRIVRRTLLIQSSEARTSNRAVVFEIADLWSELWSLWNGQNPGVFFARLFSPREGEQCLEDLLAGLPEPWNERMIQVANEVFGELVDVVKASVWWHRKVRDEGVVLPNADGAEVVERWEQFIPALIRDLRNTHHGYVNKGAMTRSRLILTDGNLPESLSMLPSLWLLAFLSDPPRFLGWPVPVA